MKTFMKILYVIFAFGYIIYLVLPNSSFPQAQTNSIQSNEPADIESDLRRAYYTNLSRTEVLNYYEDLFSKNTIVRIKLPTYRLNYPPEEAQTLIRDQTRSTFLEEIVHPFRESIYINGFQPKEDKDAIIVDNKRWNQKIIVKYIKSNVFNRLIVGVSSLLLILILSSAWIRFVKEMKNENAI